MPDKERKYSEEFKRKAVERMSASPSVVGLARELGVHWRRLYEWRDELQKAGAGDEPDQATLQAQKLREENERLKRALAEKVLEVNFFRGALQKVAAHRRAGEGSGRRASTNKSKKR